MQILRIKNELKFISFKRCVHGIRKKIEIVEKELLTLRWRGTFDSILKEKQDSSTSTSKTGENVCPFVFISSFVSFGVCIYLPYFSDIVRNPTWHQTSFR